jgi:RNA polymerase sigma-70 factor, ECF subfamily
METPKASSAMDGAELAGILESARANDTAAWGQLYKRFAPAIYRFCRRTLPTPEDAEDATSEIFMKVHEKIGQYDPERPFTAWLYKVATNHCWDVLRRRRVRQERETGTELESLPLEHPAPTQLERLVTEQTGQQVRRALGLLPARARMALVMRYYADMSYEDIAEGLGVRRGFVGVLLLRARHQLREALEKGTAAQRAGRGQEVSHEAF